MTQPLDIDMAAEAKRNSLYWGSYSVNRVQILFNIPSQRLWTTGISYFSDDPSVIVGLDPRIEKLGHCVNFF